MQLCLAKWEIGCMMYLKRAVNVYCQVGLRASPGPSFFPFLDGDFLRVVLIPSQALSGWWPPTVSALMLFQLKSSRRKASFPAISP